jgi:hypothetical protein
MSDIQILAVLTVFSLLLLFFMSTKVNRLEEEVKSLKERLKIPQEGAHLK